MIENAVIVSTAINILEKGGEVFLSELITRSIKSILEKPWRVGLSPGKTILEKLKEEEYSKIYCQKIASKILSVRTIASHDVDIFIDDIYYPLKIREATNDYIHTIKDNVRLRPYNPINIIGKAGQGKSTILKKLFLEELKNGDKFPIFVELKKIKQEKIIHFILNEFNNIGISCLEGELVDLLRSKKSILLIDGFDEVIPSLRESTYIEIIGMYERFGCDIITTSRPDTEICRLTRINNYYVEDLSADDAKGLISKIVTEENVKEKLFTSLKDNTELTETLISPILVYLLYVSHPYWESIPKKPAEFYKGIFGLLYTRHDLLKNFQRHRLSSLSIEEARKAFTGFCYITFIKEKLYFDSSDISKYFGDALSMQGSDKSQNEKIKEDIISITGLIKNDGYDTYVFIHRSIQEYHTAVFLCDLDKENSKRQFSLILENSIKSEFFNNIISFIKEISIDTFEIELLIPFLERHGFSENNIELKFDNINELITYDVKNGIVLNPPFFSKEFLRVETFIAAFYSDIKNVFGNQIPTITENINKIDHQSLQAYVNKFPKRFSKTEDKVSLLEYLEYNNRKNEITEVIMISYKRIWKQYYIPVKNKHKNKKILLDGFLLK
ncbi:NACHT domain-containing protein [Neptunomonas qingdaonensis]|uniref:NACHT domain-containing protein n=1 Tax=Neptunomonas qingdaonensis TaxID=1045558 RepID=A0A1I2TC58_9GAMM|nr:NACHT domain-containing protein [Neptunomonas qingdaonensis]SFG60176.1 NACHT domain-containing protein [Neptunomonas qingdaonensis]